MIDGAVVLRHTPGTRPGCFFLPLSVAMLATATSPDVEYLHAALDADPASAHLRRMLADAIDDVGGDGSGYRALAACGRVGCDYHATTPRRWTPHALASWFRLPNRFGFDDRPYFLPDDWFAALTWHINGPGWTCGRWKDYPTRRAAEEAAARAFLSLPAERRATLLRGECLPRGDTWYTAAR